MREFMKFSVLMAVIVLTATAGWVEEPQYAKADRVLPAAKALPLEMIEGEHFKVLDPVVNVFTLDQFRIQSDYGEFFAYGQMTLRIRLREIAALARLDEMRKSDVVKKALGREAQKSIGSVVYVAKNPKKAGKGIKDGIMRRFRSVKRDVVEDVDTARGQDEAKKKGTTIGNRFLGVEKAHRSWAQKLGVDPYSSNEVLQEELKRWAKVDAGASIGSKFIVPSIPGTGIIRDVYKAVWSYDSRELLEINTRHLVELGIPNELMTEFFAIEVMTPSLVTALVGALVELEGVGDRQIVVEQALPTQSEPEALYFLECVLMAAWFHTNEEPLVRMLGGTGVPVGLTESGRVIAFDGSDFHHWREYTDPLASEFNDAYKDLSPRRELWVAGDAAGSWKARVKDLGWKVHTGVRTRYLPRIPWGILPSEEE